MKIILVLVLSISLYPTSKTEGGLQSEIICDIAGKIWISTYVFNISALPKDCGIILVGQYAFDRDDGVDAHFMESDKDIVTELNKANRIVYTRIGFQYLKNLDWSLIFNSTKDTSTIQKETIDPLVNFLNTYNISGIMVNLFNIYNGFPDYPQKISKFVTTIKQSVKHDLKLGLIVGAWTYTNFSSTQDFDFSITNKVLDAYLINLSTLNGNCNSDTKKFGIAPITSQNPNLMTMDQVTAAISNSSIDKSKIYAMVGACVLLPNDEYINNKLLTTYSTLCSGTNSNSSQWCLNPSKLSYDQGAYAKKNYKGIVIKQLDTDDYDGTCGCGLFPVTTLFISGWKSSSLTPCAKIDQIQQS